MATITTTKLTSADQNIEFELFSLIQQLVHDSDKEKFSSWLTKVLESDSCTLFVASNEDHKIVGMLTLVSYPLLAGYPKTWIEDLVVDSASRRQGVAQALNQRACQEAKATGISAINLTTGTDNPANHLYEKMGFKVIDRNYYRLMLK